MSYIVRHPWHTSNLNHHYLGVPAVLVPLSGGPDSDPKAMRDYARYGGPMGWEEVRSPDGAGVKFLSTAFDNLLDSVSVNL